MKYFIRARVLAVRCKLHFDNQSYSSHIPTTRDPVHPVSFVGFYTSTE